MMPAELHRATLPLAHISSVPQHTYAHALMKVECTCAAVCPTLNDARGTASSDTSACAHQLTTIIRVIGGVLLVRRANTGNCALNNPNARFLATRIAVRSRKVYAS